MVGSQDEFIKKSFRTLIQYGGKLRASLAWFSSVYNQEAVNNRLHEAGLDRLVGKPTRGAAEAIAYNELLMTQLINRLVSCY